MIHIPEVFLPLSPPVPFGTLGNHTISFRPVSAPPALRSGGNCTRIKECKHPPLDGIVLWLSLYLLKKKNHINLHVYVKLFMK